MGEVIRVIYAPPLKWGAWYELLNIFGFHGNVTFEELEKGDTTVFYEVKVFPSETEEETVHSVMPNVPFYTYQKASIRGKGSLFGSAVKLRVTYLMD